MFGKTIRVTLVGALVAGTVALTQAPAGARAVIKARSNDTWRPSHVFGVTTGEKVVWKNPTNKRHDLKSMNTGKDWNLKRTRLKRNGGKYARRFKKPGNYYFRCTIHSTKTDNGWDGMTGIVHVRK